MTAQEFFYWLQGFFELSEAAATKFIITPDVARCILSHIDLVPEGERGEGLIEVRTLVRLAAKSQNEQATIGLTRDVVDAVSQVFLHVIDPKAGDAKVQADLNAKHNTHMLRPGSGVTMRC